jgi:hypothetical protein
MFCRVEGEGGDVIGFSGVADETSCCVGVEGYHEEECLRISEDQRWYGGRVEDVRGDGYTRTPRSTVYGSSDGQ